MTDAVLPLLWWRGDSFIFLGSGTFIIGQLFSLVMVGTAAFILWESIRAHAFRDLAMGLAIGTAVVVVFAGFILPWISRHPSPARIEILRELGYPV